MRDELGGCEADESALFGLNRPPGEPTGLLSILAVLAGMQVSKSFLSPSVAAAARTYQATARNNETYRTF